MGEYESLVHDWLDSGDGTPFERALIAALVTIANNTGCQHED